MRGIHGWPVNFAHEGHWRGALVFFIFTWINGWVNDRVAGDLRRHRAHYDVTVMWYQVLSLNLVDRNWVGIMASQITGNTTICPRAHRGKRFHVIASSWIGIGTNTEGKYRQFDNLRCPIDDRVVKLTVLFSMYLEFPDSIPFSVNTRDRLYIYMDFLWWTWPLLCSLIICPSGTRGTWLPASKEIGTSVTVSPLNSEHKRRRSSQDTVIWGFPDAD